MPVVAVCADDFTIYERFLTAVKAAYAIVFFIERIPCLAKHRRITKANRRENDDP